ncbi:MAG: RecQ family ATP-dependent DNA helicase [Flavobacteriaceae bacterium]|nr:RecQ family ATP-dependent DNA helicase [Flavobacteriaceae bacterium]
MDAPLEVLKHYWNYDTFREPQADIIDALLKQENVFALLPTGAGKSICFQVPAMLLEGVCVVISPLIALMQDQVDNLKKKGIKAAVLSATLKQNEVVDLFDNLAFGGYKFLYLSPERLQSEFIQQKLKQLTISIIAIDEAHCISEWGHDFRPSYRKVNVITNMHPQAKVIALTASATTKVTDDILKSLQLNAVVRFKSSLVRPEIHYSVKKTNAVRQGIKNILSTNGQPAIVYMSSRKATKSISEYLNKNHIKSSFYHGGLSPIEKQKSYKDWLSETTPVMVATNAFGMGIDKNNVTKIIHANLPLSIENYMQESGRAGRNGNKSIACLLYNDASIAEFKSHFKKALVSLDFLKEIYDKLNQFFQIALGEKPVEPLAFDLARFCTTYNVSYLKTFNAISILEKEGIIELTENLNRKSTLKFISNKQQIFKYSEQHAQLDKLIKIVLRTYGGLFEHDVKIDEFILSRKANLVRENVVQLLARLHNDKILDYKPVLSDQSISFLVPREDSYTINRIADSVKQRQKIKQEKQEGVLNYIANTDLCRTRQLLSYFGEKEVKDCGCCDVCISRSAPATSVDFNSISERILKLLASNPLSSRELIKMLKQDQNAVLSTLQLLLDKNKISITSQNKFQLK